MTSHQALLKQKRVRKGVQTERKAMTFQCLSVKGIIRVFTPKFRSYSVQWQTKVVDATIQRHSSQNCLIFQWWSSKVDPSASYSLISLNVVLSMIDNIIKKKNDNLMLISKENN